MKKVLGLKVLGKLGLQGGNIRGEKALWERRSVNWFLMDKKEHYFFPARAQ